MYAIKVIFKYLFITFLVIQVIHPTITNEKTDPKLEIKAPKEVMHIFKRACYDCHSNQVKAPWYSNIAPISWGIVRHIDLGKQWLNFSIWETYTKEQKDKKLQEIYTAVYKAMPLESYMKYHPEAHLTKEDRELIRKWTGKAPF